MDSALGVHRLHFAFTVTYHYLFPQLTMGLAPIIVILKALALRRPRAGSVLGAVSPSVYADAARLLARIFAVGFVFGVVTGVPMEFQFGTNWARFSKYAGGVIGQTLAMEGMFAFFAESAFVGLFLFGERRLSPRAHLGATVAVWLGSWLSGYFIVATDAWMQHPVGFVATGHGTVELTSFWALVANRWALIQYAHTMGGALVTGAFGTASLGAYYLLRDARLRGVHAAGAATLLRVGVVTAAVASLWQLFPSGDRQGALVARHQPASLAAMEGVLTSAPGPTPIVLVGQPDLERSRIDNALEVPGVLSMLTYRRWNVPVRALDTFAPELRPDNVVLLYYCYHVMVGLGTVFIALMGVSLWGLARGWLLDHRPWLWAILLAAPLPYVANTAGWMTAEIGRQPWLVYGLMATAKGTSPRVSAGNGWFSLLGFMGLYTVMSMVFVLLIARIVRLGPVALGPPEAHQHVPDETPQAKLDRAAE